MCLFGITIFINVLVMKNSSILNTIADRINKFRKSILNFIPNKSNSIIIRLTETIKFIMMNFIETTTKSNITERIIVRIIFNKVRHLITMTDYFSRTITNLMRVNNKLVNHTTPQLRPIRERIEQESPCSRKEEQIS